MIDNRPSGRSPRDGDPAFTRTAVALLLLGSLMVGALSGALSTLAVSRMLQRPQAIGAGAPAGADPAGAVEEASSATVAIAPRGLEPSDSPPSGGANRSALGTGFVLDDQGHILTTGAVAKGDRLQVVFADGRSAIATLVGVPDRSTGVTVLKVSATVPDPPRFARLSQLKLGDSLISLGTALEGFGRTADVGYVVALRHASRLAGRQEVDNLVQTDALAPEGAAGGPVVNARGEVVGIMAAPAAEAGGWSLVLPAETSRGVARRIIGGGSDSEASLGVQPVNITPEIAEAQNLSQKSGALVNAVFPGSPAARRLKKGDIITAVDGKALDERRTLDSILVEYRAGDKVNLQVVRNGLVSRVSVRLVRKPAPAATPSPAGEPTP